MEKSLPPIPAKRYFTIGEVSELCGVKPYVLRYWEQEFTQLKPMKRRGNRRYYQHHEVLLIRRIRELLYEQGFTISGARNRLAELLAGARGGETNGLPVHELHEVPAVFDDEASQALDAPEPGATETPPAEPAPLPLPEVHELTLTQMRSELLSIRGLLTV
jgi:DNA-binding transcriptional MerR regulator